MVHTCLRCFYIIGSSVAEWFGFWKHFQSQVENSLELLNAAKFTYLIGQPQGEALTTANGVTLSDQKYDISTGRKSSKISHILNTFFIQHSSEFETLDSD